MHLNELKEQYREQLQDGSCQYEIEDMENIEDMVLDSDTFSQDKFDNLEEFDGKNIVTESEEKLDYITEETVGEYTNDNIHDAAEIVENVVKYETKNICDDGSCNQREERPNVHPGFFRLVSRFFQPLFAIAP